MLGRRLRDASHLPRRPTGSIYRVDLPRDATPSLAAVFPPVTKGGSAAAFLASSQLVRVPALPRAYAGGSRACWKPLAWRHAAVPEITVAVPTASRRCPGCALTDVGAGFKLRERNTEGAKQRIALPREIVWPKAYNGYPVCGINQGRWNSGGPPC